MEFFVHNSEEGKGSNWFIIESIEAFSKKTLQSVTCGQGSSEEQENYIARAGHDKVPYGALLLHTKESHDKRWHEKKYHDSEEYDFVPGRSGGNLKGCPEQINERRDTPPPKSGGRADDDSSRDGSSYDLEEVNIGLYPNINGVNKYSRSLAQASNKNKKNKSQLKKSAKADDLSVANSCNTQSNFAKTLKETKRKLKNIIGKITIGEAEVPETDAFRPDSSSYSKSTRNEDFCLSGKGRCDSYLALRQKLELECELLEKEFSNECDFLALGLEEAKRTAKKNANISNREDRQFWKDGYDRLQDDIQRLEDKHKKLYLERKRRFNELEEQANQLRMINEKLHLENERLKRETSKSNLEQEKRFQTLEKVTNELRISNEKLQQERGAIKKDKKEMRRLGQDKDKLYLEREKRFKHLEEHANELRMANEKLQLEKNSLQREQEDLLLRKQKEEKARFNQLEEHARQMLLENVKRRKEQEQKCKQLEKKAKMQLEMLSCNESFKNLVVEKTRK